VQGIWAPNIEDATCCSTNHRYRLIVFGRKKFVSFVPRRFHAIARKSLRFLPSCYSSEAVVYTIDEKTGGLEVSHTLVVSSQVYPGEVGAVHCLKWTSDGCALALSWTSGGFSVWSTFGALLVCSLGWNYGLHVELNKHNPLVITSMVRKLDNFRRNTKELLYVLYRCCRNGPSKVTSYGWRIRARWRRTPTRKKRSYNSNFWKARWPLIRAW
jgi:hypothetical protein